MIDSDEDTSTSAENTFPEITAESHSRDAHRIALTESGIHPEMLRVGPSGSLEPAPPAGQLDEPLQKLAEQEIRLKHVIGKGGMGDVFLGDQKSLEREVAVKRPRGEGDRETKTNRLVLEARIAGYVEHPNVIPVHVLGADEAGNPLLVMKRVEGEAWNEILEDGVDLQRDLPILMDVCQALHFAHSRGIVHRDIKPHNVMVGRFGEVYLLDWGLAAAFGRRPPRRLIETFDPDRIIGTPAYLAPEMVLGGAAPDPRSDVYLVGAVLHELMTGRPPHRGANIMDTLVNARMSSAPEFDESVPEELAAICTRAMAPDPDDRFPTAESLRLALAEFQSHAAARDLAKQAQEKLAVLKSKVHDADEQRVHRLFGECRFAFRQALNIDPASRQARRGLYRAQLFMAKREVEHERVDLATAIVAELEGDAPDELVASLSVLKKRRDDERADAQVMTHLAKDFDMSAGWLERNTMTMSGASTWALGMVGLFFLERRGAWSTGPGTMATLMSFLTVFYIGVSFAVPAIRATTASRGLSRAVISCAASISAVMGLSWILGLPAATAIAFGQIALTAGTVGISIQQHRPWWPSALTLLFLAPLFLWPSLALLVGAAAGFVSTMLLPAMWKRAELQGKTLLSRPVESAKRKS